MKDLLPCAYPYLKDIVKDINEKELPYVMSIEGGFGSGKTYFVTRLCQYVKDTKKNAVYFNAFEYDDTEPKIAILNAIAKDGIFKKIRQKLKKVSANINTGIGFSIPLNKVLFKETMDEIRNVLEKEIQKSGRLVLIIDELDRCNSSFCKDLLETIKHFFDLDGLFIILSFSCEALSNAFKYTYGLDFINTKAENYLTKFIDHRTEIYSIESDSYKQVINKFFCDNKLRISENELSNITDVFADMHLTMREVIRCVEKIIILINTLNTKENISLYSYIAYRYDKDFEKIKSMKFIDDNSIEEQQKFVKRKEQFSHFEKESKYNRACQDIVYKHHIWKYTTKYCSGEYTMYHKLQNDIRRYYEVLCKDYGNAKKLAEVFLLELFTDIETLF